jgi:hypothetical protein
MWCLCNRSENSDERVARYGLQSRSVKSFVARQSSQNKQLTAARSTAIVQSSGSALPAMIAAEIVIAAIPHIKVIARLIK